ncbi:MAG: hypothetical protein ABUT39_13765 [Acidobacteriota bacterium]
MTPGRPTIVLLLSSGWGVRTFLQTDVLPELLENARIVLFAAPDLVPTLRERLGGDVPVEPLHPFDPNAGAYGRAYRRRNHRFLRLGSTATRRIKQAEHRRTLRGVKGLAFDLLELDARLFARREGLPAMEKTERRLLLRDYPHAAEYERRLRAHGADLVVSTLPHAHEEAPPAIVARHLGIPTAAWINSWDNLTSKPAYFTAYDHYFVWSGRMRDELLRHYPEAAHATVDATGVPHFDWYVSGDLRLAREELFALYGFDPKRPMVLYGTATPHLAPAEHLVVKRLAEDLAKAEVLGFPQLLVRLHPGDAGRRFRDWRPGPSVALQVPGERGHGQLGGYCPTHEENRELVSSILHAGAVINLASTLTLDAALCDRPVVNTAFDLAPERSFQKAIAQYYSQYDHYRTVVESGAVRLAGSPEELLAHVTAYLSDPGLEREGRRRVVDLWCGPVDGGSGRRLAAALLGRLREARG